MGIIKKTLRVKDQPTSKKKKKEKGKKEEEKLVYPKFLV